MKQLLAGLIAAALAGCTSYGEWREVDATPRLLNGLPEFSSITVTLRDGRKEHLGAVRAYGDVLCGDGACVRNGDVARVRYQERNVDILATALAVPLLPIAAAVCLTGCDYGAAVCGDRYKPAGPSATPEQAGRQWLDDLIIVDGILASDRDENPCVAPHASAVSRSFASDAEAFAWIVANRQQVSWVCLDHTLRRLDDIDRKPGKQAHRESRMQLSALAASRMKWNDSRCMPDPGRAWLARSAAERVVPDNRFNLDGRQGDAKALQILEQTLADRSVYAFDGDLETRCSTGALPREHWPDVNTWIAAHSPFAPAPELPLPSPPQ